MGIDQNQKVRKGGRVDWQQDFPRPSEQPLVSSYPGDDLPDRLPCCNLLTRLSDMCHLTFPLRASI